MGKAIEAEAMRALQSNAGLAVGLASYAGLGNWRELVETPGRIWAVTPEDVARVATNYFVEDNRTVGWRVPEEK